MSRIYRCVHLFLIGAFCALPLQVTHATVLTFDAPPVANFEPLPVDYGDNVAAPTVGTYSYEMGNGWTPQIAIDYRTLDVAGGNAPTLDPELAMWTTDYNELVNVAYPIRGTSMGEITFVPSPGYGVRLNQFNFGNWNFTQQTNQPVRVYDENYQLLYSLDLIVPGRNQPSHLIAPNITSFGVLHLQFGDNWNVGVDNVNFDQVAIPEPSIWLAACGAIAMSVAVRQYRVRKSA